MNPNRSLLLLPASSLAHLLGSHILQIDGQPVRIVLGIRQNLGRIKREDGLGDDSRGFIQKVRVVDSQGLVVPVDFPRDQGLGDEPELEDDPLDLGSLLVLLGEIGRLVAAATGSSRVSICNYNGKLIRNRRLDAGLTWYPSSTSAGWTSHSPRSARQLHQASKLRARRSHRLSTTATATAQHRKQRDASALLLVFTLGDADGKPDGTHILHLGSNSVHLFLDEGHRVVSSPNRAGPSVSVSYSSSLPFQNRA
jgi:hypothetical protein